MKRITILCSDANHSEYNLENQDFSQYRYLAQPVIDLDNATESHDFLGFGVSITDSSAYLIAKLPEKKQNELIRDLFTPEGLNLSIIRLNVGASDYATGIYSYNDSPDDFEMKNFSIAQDMEYLIPLIKKIKAANPDVYIFASPWSPPGWMKSSGSMCGGYMLHKYLPAFADYYVEYLKAYRAAGIEINAISMQNESDTHQGGTMPQSFLHPEYEAELVGELLPPRLKAVGLTTKIWLHDHNYDGWERVLFILRQPGVLENTDAVAFHSYCGVPSMMQIIRDAYPDLKLEMTEKSPTGYVDSPAMRMIWWGKDISETINHGCASYIGWNCALDENGLPNLGMFQCRGLVDIHSETQEIIPGVQYQAFRHIAPYFKRGGKILNCSPEFALPDQTNISCCRNPDGSIAVFASNASISSPQALQLKYHNQYLRLLIPKESIITAILF